MPAGRLSEARVTTRALLFGGGLLAVAAGLDAAAVAHEGHKPPPGSGRSAYAFPMAAPGSYRLPPIKPAGRGAVLDDARRPHELGELFRDRSTVLAFIYTRCGDVCPLAVSDMARLQDLAAKDRRLSCVRFCPNALG